MINSRDHQALSKLLDEYPESSCSSNAGGACCSSCLEILLNEGTSAVREGGAPVLPGNIDDTNTNDHHDDDIDDHHDDHDRHDVGQEPRNSDLLSPLKNVVKLITSDIDAANGKNSDLNNVSDQESGLIGAIVAKVFDGLRYIGHVTAYEAESGHFKITYENYYKESVDKEELLHMFASQDLVRTYYNRVATGGKTRKSTRRRKKAAKGSLAVRDQNKSSYIPAKRIPRAKKENTYVPLAIRETRKDAYYWYYY